MSGEVLAGSFRIPHMVAAPAGGFWRWNTVVQLAAFLVYPVASTAEVHRTPFDLPEAETELVAGFHPEYSSVKFSLLQMAEYVNVMTVAALGTNLFLGGWNPPLDLISATAFGGSGACCGSPSRCWRSGRGFPHTTLLIGDGDDHS